MSYLPEITPPSMILIALIINIMDQIGNGVIYLKRAKRGITCRLADRGS